MQLHSTLEYFLSYLKNLGSSTKFIIEIGVSCILAYVTLAHFLNFHNERV